jgi:uncharacterized short protein YbdD (DUF466 family)
MIVGFRANMQSGAAGCYDGLMAASSVPSRASLGGLILAVGSVIRRIIGAPDYEGYLEHVQRAHPGEQPLTEKEFVRRQMENRGRPGARCC